MHPTNRSVILLVLLASLANAQGLDRHVDAVHGPYNNITEAMLDSLPGDRILVHPGTYPMFQFSRGVHVIGLGASPSDVVIQRIAFHISIPVQGYDAVLTNVRVTSNALLDIFSVSGNELGPGTFTIAGCVLENGVYLRGGQAGFYLVIDNCRIEPRPGYGFSNEAARLGGPGNFVEVRGTHIRSWDADPSSFIPAGDALRLDNGTVSRITGSILEAGDGAGTGVYARGGTALVTIPGGSVEVGLDGGSTLTGGHGAGLGAGGHGTLVGGLVRVGAASILPGTGIPPGSAHAGSAAIDGRGTLALEAAPNHQFAAGNVALLPGQTLNITVPGGPGQAFLGIATRIILPAGLFIGLEPTSTTILPSDHFDVTIPEIPGLERAGVMVYIQGARVDPVTLAIVTTDTNVFRVDL